MEYPANYCTFPLVCSPEDYLDNTRITQIWRGLLQMKPEWRVSLHACPLPFMDMDRRCMVGSDLFLAEGGSVVLPAEEDLPAPHGPRIHSWWEGRTPNPAAHLTLTVSPVPDDPAAACKSLEKATLEDLTWSIPSMAHSLDDGDTLVLLPVETDFILTPEKAALAWEWFDAFLDRACGLRSPLMEDGPVAILGAEYHYEHKDKPAQYKVERMMSLYPKPEAFYAPQGAITCPECGAEPEFEVLADRCKALLDAESPHLRFPSPCCGKTFSFNHYHCGWLAFARFAMHGIHATCTDSDLAELSALMQAPFKAMYTHI